VCRVIDGPEEDDARTLYVHTGRRVTVTEGETRLVDCAEDEGGTLVSSEPLSMDVGWEAVPGNHLVLVEGPGRAQVRPVSLA
jgi:predicted glutamine amidotransferase